MTFSANISLVLPELVLGVSALLLLVWGAFSKKTTPVFTGASVLALLAAAVLAAIGPHGHAFNGVYSADAAASYAKVAIFLFSALAIVLGDRWLAARGDQKFEFPVLVVLSAVGMGVTASAGDLISLYIGVELQSLALYVLAAFRRDDAKASEAGLKYFVLGALSSGILLYGASLIYGFAGSTRFADIAVASHGAHGLGLLFGLIFVICGLAFKVSAAPFHMWTPDVYEGAPTPVVGFFAAAPKLAAMMMFARVLGDAFPDAVSQWRQVLIIAALLSVFVGAFAGLAQTNLKRLWAYSSIANVGYALLGVATGGEVGIHSMLVFMVLYMVDVTGFFACLQALNRDGKPMETIEDMAGLVKQRPGVALALTAFSLSALGLPPFSGFWAKFYVFKAAMGAGDVPLQWAAVLGLVGSVVAAFYYLRLIKAMWFDAPAGAVDKPQPTARAIGFAAALFSFPVVLVALIWLDPAAKLAAAAFGHL
ncbi:NADH-quinone oxidoreductase subunit NuoN [Caulobacter endophyticus]|uniref:NADH-quinone oxidoreductase subunit N n=1 Tax=Caulobacter endophyticus TaxID=2172652 RepID=A0A2T9JHD4_9CAUL|nr:NADH-quinone oxidoreductase subunit NuoN [Caulobacter endophyticus]PVM83076.1 NADH-quinone oxidoreductase subunit NuoN [Caulobacter endophyticus]